MRTQRTFTAEDWRPFVRGPDTPLDDLIGSILVRQRGESNPLSRRREVARLAEQARLTNLAT